MWVCMFGPAVLFGVCWVWWCLVSPHVYASLVYGYVGPHGWCARWRVQVACVGWAIIRVHGLPQACVWRVCGVVVVVVVVDA